MVSYLNVAPLRAPPVIATFFYGASLFTAGACTVGSTVRSLGIVQVRRGARSKRKRLLELLLAAAATTTAAVISWKLVWSPWWSPSQAPGGADNHRSRPHTNEEVLIRRHGNIFLARSDGSLKITRGGARRYPSSEP